MKVSREYDIELYETSNYKVFFSNLFFLVFVRLFLFIGFLSPISILVFVLCFLQGHLFCFFFFFISFRGFCGSAKWGNSFFFFLDCFLDFLTFFHGLSFFLLSWTAFWTLISFFLLETFLFAFWFAFYCFRSSSLLSFLLSFLSFLFKGLSLSLSCLSFSFSFSLQCLHSFRKLYLQLVNFLSFFLLSLYFVLSFHCVFFPARCLNSLLSKHNRATDLFFFLLLRQRARFPLLDRLVHLSMIA